MRSGVSAMENHEEIAQSLLKGPSAALRAYRKLPDENHCVAKRGRDAEFRLFLSVFFVLGDEIGATDRENESRAGRLVDLGAANVFSSEEDAIYPPNATGFNLQMAKHKAVANVTHAR